MVTVEVKDLPWVSESELYRRVICVQIKINLHFYVYSVEVNIYVCNIIEQTLLENPQHVKCQ